MKIISFEKRKMKLLTKKRHDSYENVVYVKKNLKINI